MLKKIRRGFLKQLKIVKKYSSQIEAELAQEVLEAYHINAFIIREYFKTIIGSKTVRRMKDVMVMVNPYDYDEARHLLDQ